MYKSRDFVGFLQYINLDESHIDTLVKDFYVLEKAGLIEVFSNAVNSLEEKGFPNKDYYLFLEEIPALIKGSSVSEYSASFIFICACAPHAYNLSESKVIAKKLLKILSTIIRLR